MTDIREYLKQHKIIADGAFGTYYQQKAGEEACLPELANLKNPRLVRHIHKKYIAAGAMLLRTNSFAANSISMRCDCETVKQVVRASYENAERAVADSGKEVYIAADIGPIPHAPFEEDSREQRAEYELIIDTFMECGARLFCFETLSEIGLVHKLAKYIRSKDSSAFILTQYTLNKYGYTKMGISAGRILSEISADDNIDAVGFNCGIGSAHLYEILKKQNLNTSKFLTAMPNSGYPELLQDRTVYSGNSDYFAQNLKDIAELGINIIGGCCGTTPSYIKKLTENVELANNRELTQGEIRIKKEPQKAVVNDFYQAMESGKKVITVELDPPYDANAEKIMDCAHRLKGMGVDMITFADSPMGKARADSCMMGIKVMNQVGIPVMPHIACRDKNVISMRASILGAYLNGIRNFLFVTGDPVPAESRSEISGVFDFNSMKLMQYVSGMNQEHFKEQPVCFGGAINQNRGRLEVEIGRIEKKIAAGARYFLTQPIFSEEDIEKIRTIKESVDAKILCGIMPLISYRNASFIKNEIYGIDVPDDVLAQFSPDMTREEGEAVGIRVAKSVMEKLDSIADGYYFMLPFNRVHLVEQILNN